MYRSLRIFLAVLLLTKSVFAAEPVERFNSSALWFENWQGLSNATLVVQAPDGTLISVHAENGTPVFRLDGDTILDGIYRYELTAATDELVPIINPQNNGRGDAQQDSIPESILINGHITVYRGAIIQPEDITETNE